jgi:hypothetical protein
MEPDSWMVLAFGIAPIAVAGVLVSLRDELVSTNLALILVVVVVLAAAVGGRLAGAVTAVTAALSFDFFLTKPYLSLHISSADDVETTVLLLVVGLIVGQVAVLSSRHRMAAERGRSEIGRMARVADMVARGEDPADVLLAAQAELTELLDLDDCRFDAGSSGSELSRLERTGAITGATTWRFSGGELALPAAGVSLPVLYQGHPVGQFALYPTGHAGASLEARVVAVAIADQVGAALGARAGGRTDG